MLFSELKCKDVINMRDCKKLGRISDLEFDQCSGQICKVFIPSGNLIYSARNLTSVFLTETSSRLVRIL